MADGAIFGRLSGSGYAAHTDASATPVAAVTLPTTPDGLYKIRAEVWGGETTGVNTISNEAQCTVKVDASTLSISEVTTSGSSTYTVGFAISGGDVQVTVTAISGYHTGAIITAHGFELAIA
jgi:hypothetical protein